jgi:hypothetical protein
VNELQIRIIFPVSVNLAGINERAHSGVSEIKFTIEENTQKIRPRLMKLPGIGGVGIEFSVLFQSFFGCGIEGKKFRD